MGSIIQRITLAVIIIISHLEFVRCMPRKICSTINDDNIESIELEYKRSEPAINASSNGVCECVVIPQSESPHIIIKVKGGGGISLCGRTCCREKLLLAAHDDRYDSCYNVTDDSNCINIPNNEELLDTEDGGDVTIVFNHARKPTNDMMTQEFKIQVEGQDVRNVRKAKTKFSIRCNYRVNTPDQSTCSSSTVPSGDSSTHSSSGQDPVTETSPVSSDVSSGNTSVTKSETDQPTVIVTTETMQQGSTIGLYAGVGVAAASVVIVVIIVAVVFGLRRSKDRPVKQPPNNSSTSRNSFSTHIIDNATYDTNLKAVPSDTDLVDNLQYSAGTFKDPDHYSEATEIHDNPTYGSDLITPTSVYTDDTQLVDNNTYTDINDKQPDPIQFNLITPTNINTDDTQLVDNNM